MDLIRQTSSSITLKDIMKKNNTPSTHAYSGNVDKTITQGKVEGSVEVYYSSNHDTVCWHHFH